MKIAFVVKQFPALSETFILRQITGLLDRGHEVDIFAYSPGNDPVRHADVEKYALLQRTYYLRECAFSDPAPVRAARRIAQVFTNFHKNPAVVLKTLNVATFGKGALFLQVFCQIIPFLGKVGYDVIHCQFGDLGELGLLLKKTGLFRGKLVTSFRGYDVSSYLRFRGDDVYSDLFRRGDLFLGVSEHIKQKLIRLGCEERKVVVHRSGVNINNNRTRPNNAQSDGKLRVLTVARLTEKKGIAYGIRAVAKVLQKYRNIEYNIAGDGPLKKSLEVLISELKVDGRVKLLGWKSQDEISDLLENSDILLAPSVTTETGDQEGIPGVIMEAFAHGLPVLSTYHAGITEVVEDGQSGFLVPEADDDTLAQKLECLIERSDLRDEMGLNGRKFVEEHCDIDKLNDRLASLYRQLIDMKLSRTKATLEDLPPAHAA